MSDELLERLKKYTGSKFTKDSEKFNELRSKYKKFTFYSYDSEEDNNTIILYYNYGIESDIETLLFKHQLNIDKKKFAINKDLKSDIVQNILFNIGMAEAASYYKLTCSKQFDVKCGKLNYEQTEWWKKLYYLGLGEFRYRNNIELEINEFFTITSNGTEYKKAEIKEVTGNLIPVGGGKDSAVTMSLLHKYKDVNNLFVIDTNKVHYDSAIKTIIAAGYETEDVFEVERLLDKKLYSLNEQGFLNGHIPISSVIAFISLLAATFLGKKYIVLSNESSANEATIIGSNINHQYSKSYEFEKDFHDYVEKNITPSIKYFSLLRPWSELRIAKELSKHPEYFPVFKSCNVGSQKGIWCGKCAKCLFSYIILVPFVGEQIASNIFGKNMLDDGELKEIFEKLVDEEKNKIFDCIGTKSEIYLALSITLEKYKANKIRLPKLLEYFEDKYYTGVENTIELDKFDNDNLVPNEYISILK